MNHQSFPPIKYRLDLMSPYFCGIFLGLKMLGITHLFSMMSKFHLLYIYIAVAYNTSKSSSVWISLEGEQPLLITEANTIVNCILILVTNPMFLLLTAYLL